MREIRLTVFGKLLRDAPPAFALTLRDIDGILLHPDTFPARSLMARGAGPVHVSQSDQRRGMREQLLEPGQLVRELRTRLRVAVGQVERRDEDAVDGGFEVARLRIGGVAGQRAPHDDRLAAAREKGNAVSALLCDPGAAIAGACR